MDYNEALNFILKKQSLGIMPGLSRILSLLDKMGNPQDKIKIIHIAGTNGKGTVANTIANALMNNGCKVGLFTSPWLVDYREQIQINNQFISIQDFANYVDIFKDNDCSEFEFLTAIMYKYFADKKVDYAVIECGMGGKNDATNVEKENVCSVLTSISIDHTNLLGSTIEEITYEKEGIIRNSPCFRYENVGSIDDSNLFLAKKVVGYLGLNNNIKLVKPIARQQTINNVLYDGGHNLEAGIELSKIINNEIAVIGMMADKNVDGYLSYVAPKCKKIICTKANNPRSISTNELKNIASKYCDDVIVEDNPLDAIKHNPTLICGSFYLIREIINLI